MFRRFCLKISSFVVKLQVSLRTRLSSLRTRLSASLRHSICCVAGDMRCQSVAELFGNNYWNFNFDHGQSFRATGARRM